MRSCGIHMALSGNRIWCSWFSVWKLPFQEHTMVYHGIPYIILTFFRHQNFPWHQLKGTLSSWTRATKSGRICGILYIPATRLAISMAKKSKIVLIGIRSFKLGFSVLWVHFIVLVIWPCLTNTFIGQNDVKLCVSLCFCIVFDQFSWSPFSSYFIISFTIIPINSILVNQPGFWTLLIAIENHRFTC
jgi:hypothetical protein